ncbi:hypothetical protein [Rhizobium sp.]
MMTTACGQSHCLNLPTAADDQPSPRLMKPPKRVLMAHGMQEDVLGLPIQTFGPFSDSADKSAGLSFAYSDAFWLLMNCISVIIGLNGFDVDGGTKPIALLTLLISQISPVK